MRFSKLLFLAAVLLLSLNSTLGSVPERVLNKFNHYYPEGKQISWEQQADHFVVMFKDRGLLKKAFFEPNGYWVETRIRQEEPELPMVVSDFLNSFYPTATVNFCAVAYNESQIWYHVESELKDRVVIKKLDEHGLLFSKKTIAFSTNH